MVTMDDKVDRNTILNSGIFVFDNKGKLLGLKRLQSDKRLTNRVVTEENRKDIVLEIQPNRLKLFADEIVAQINSYLHGQLPNTLQSVIDHFEHELTDTFKRWDLDTDNLNPHYSNLLKKCKKIIKLNLEQDAKKMAQIDTKPNLRRDDLVAGLKRSFDEYIKIDITDTFHYITYLLIGCGLEKGKHKTVFNKIFKAHNRIYL